MSVYNKNQNGKERIEFYVIKEDDNWKIRDYKEYALDENTAMNVLDSTELKAIVNETMDTLNDVLKVANGQDVEINDDIRNAMVLSQTEDGYTFVNFNTPNAYTSEAQNGDIYYEVTDPRFKTLDDIVDYISDRVCDDYRDTLINDAKSYYRMGMDKLYCRKTDVEYNGFDFTTNIEIADRVENSMLIKTSFIANGEETPIEIQLYLVDGKWKIADYRF